MSTPHNILPAGLTWRRLYEMIDVEYRHLPRVIFGAHGDTRSFDMAVVRENALNEVLSTLPSETALWQLRRAVDQAAHLTGSLPEAHTWVNDRLRALRLEQEAEREAAYAAHRERLAPAT